MKPSPRTPALTSLIYVSRARTGIDAPEIDAIIAASLIRNAALEITGALVFTGRYFAQLLEGPQPALDLLMASITGDSRHEQLQVIETVAIQRRRFVAWAMAYWGTATFVDGLIDTIWSDEHAHEQADVERLNMLIYQMALQGGGRPIGLRG